MHRGRVTPSPVRRDFFLACVLGTAAAASTAEARERIPYAGLRGGYLQVEGVDAGSFNLGVLGGLYFLPRLALEGSVDYHSPDFDDYSRTTYAFQVSAAVYPFALKHAFRPYGVAGAGFYWNYYESEEESVFFEDNRTDGGFHAGLGFDVILGDLTGWKGAGPKPVPLCLTVDLRYLFTRDDEGGTRSDGLLATVGVKVGF